MFADKTLQCKDCGENFIFTVGEQEFYLAKGLLNEPMRCKNCRIAKKTAIKTPFVAICAKCGREAHVPFEPREGRPVYCAECFAKSISRPAAESGSAHEAECFSNSTSRPAAESGSAHEFDFNKLHTEISKWSVEAKREDIAYFYNVRETDLIANGQKSFVIGRKGSGKTSIAQYLVDLKYSDTFSVPLSFKNFPFNILYSLENQGEYTAPNQYISIWKYLIFSCVCKQMIVNQNINPDIQDKLMGLYGDSSVERLDKLIKNWTSKVFGVSILGNGFNYEREQTTHDMTWLDAMDVLQQVILEYCDSSKYFIIFDELDEDYKSFDSPDDYNRYMSMLTSLFKAVQDIRGIFDSNGKNIFPIVFLRSDIFNRIKDSDKNKWSERIISLEWDRAQIQKMLTHRLCVALGEDTKNQNFDVIWHKLFGRGMVSMGHQANRKMDIYSYIERSTEMRPRDFIQYIKECVELNGFRPQLISPTTVKDADDNFSEYLKKETIDEAFAVLPEIDEILGLLSTIRKQEFRFEAFEREYDILVKNHVIPKREVKHILLTLFDVGVIGNKPSMIGKTIFKFSGKGTPRFNFNETMLVHRGLFKSLQIF